MNDDLAHSASTEYGIPAQSYYRHVKGVYDGAVRNADTLSRICPEYKNLFYGALLPAAEYHDLGKILKPNQDALAFGGKKLKLPINHTDAGAAFVKKVNLLAAMLIRSHHIGLPNLTDEFARKPEEWMRDLKIKETVDAEMEYLIGRHRFQFMESGDLEVFRPPEKPSTLTYRLLLSCLVDADWSDTSRNYYNIVPIDDIELRPAERLASLNAYVKELGKNKTDKRSRVRKEVYEAARRCKKMDRMLQCELPVGVGKTTAVMAHALKIAKEKGIQRIFTVQPLTSLIDQTTEVLRKAIVLPDENAPRIVAAHHHRVDYENESCRQYAATWSSPNIVVTAVQFFETLASNHPAALRKLHHLPGSLIIFDEFHAALPPHLLQLAWKWLKELVEHWGCYIIFSSGSPIRFWEMEDFVDKPVEIPAIVPDALLEKTIRTEKVRVFPKLWRKRHTVKSLCKWVLGAPGPRLVEICTVQSSAVVTREMIKRVGPDKVEHLSTALSPHDRQITLARIRKRLQDPNDTDWTLVATSCVESGLDLSFREGFCESRSLISLRQLIGRVSRNCEYKNAVLHVFRLKYDRYLREHPAFIHSREVLEQLFKKGKIGPEFCTDAFRKEMNMRSSSDVAEDLDKSEKGYQFEYVNDHFNIIAAGTITVVLPEMAARLASGEKVNWWDIQDHSVQIWERNGYKWGVADIPGYDDIKAWTLPYDSKLGIMAGVLPLIDAEKSNMYVV